MSESPSAVNVTILYNAPALPPDHPDYASEAGVLESVQAFDAVLRTAGHVVQRLALHDDVGELVDHVAAKRPDVVVNFCESFAGQPGGESHVAALLEMLHVPYTGGSPENLALVRDKVRTKWLLLGAGLPTAPFRLLRRSDPMDQTTLAAALGSWPWFVKPAAEDASLGISADSVVCDWAAAVRQVFHLRERFGDVLVEQ